MSSLLLDQSTWDLLLAADGNIAVATDPYALAQDAASAIKTFAGECYFDTTVGIPYLTQILGHAPSISLLKAQFAAAAETVPGVDKATCFISSIDDRIVSGQVQVTSDAGATAAADFAANFATITV